MQTTSWKQISAHKYPTRNEAADSVKVKSENIQLKAELTQKQKQLRQNQHQLKTLKQTVDTTHHNLKKLLSYLGYRLNNEFVITLDQLFKILEQKLKENKYAIDEYENQLKSNLNNHEENSKSISQLKSVIDRLHQQNKKNNQHYEECLLQKQKQCRALIEERQHLAQRIQLLEIQNSDIKKKIQTEGDQEHGGRKIRDEAKEQCLQLLEQIKVDDDEYLRGYLIENSRHVRSMQAASRRDKYNFIFNH